MRYMRQILLLGSTFFIGWDMSIVEYNLFYHLHDAYDAFTKSFIVLCNTRANEVTKKRQVSSLSPLFLDMTTKRELPSKESAVFKNVLRHYEHKQYKKGLKLADSILKKYPDHGETLAMKGLFLNNLDKKEEGYEFVKKGVANDLTSHICWHVYGLMHRGDKNYEEASKCYTNALKYNKNDPHILRDHALLQTQLRHYDQLIETRAQLLQQKPTYPPFWIGLAIAYQLGGKIDNALTVLKSQEESVKEIGNAFEHSELLMYHNSLLEEKGDYQAALDHLETIKEKVTDQRSLKEKRAAFLANLNKVEEAEAAYRGLISENPHDRAYITALLALKGLENDKKGAYDFCKELAEEYPRSKIMESLLLQYAEGADFETKVDTVLRKSLIKGVPSLFASMKKYYADSAKQTVIDKLVQGYRASLEKKGTFDDKSDKREPPSVLLWTLYYLAQHHDYHKQFDQALECINAAIEHTPTIVELYMTKGRILKHKGQIEEAAKVMNEARELDLQDRFINSKCAKYMLRAGQIEEAEKILAMFTRKEVSAVQDLTDMQCHWFHIEEGYAYLRQKNYGKALKRFHVTQKIFDDIYDDQFDFHGYCLRKMTIRAYVKMLRFEDNLRQHHYYVTAAKGAVEAYLAIADKPKESNGLDESGMTEAEKKKARSKARKAELKALQDKENVKEDAAATAAASGANKKDSKKSSDEDPDGEKYLNTATPLDDAMQFIKPLMVVAPNLVDTHALAFEVYLRQSQWVLALRCLVKIAEIDKSNPAFEKGMDRFKKAVASAGPLQPAIQKIIDLQMAKI
ncbi:n-alpha-acetyltransferase auxiliary subunit-like [Lichtheimia corymbifera JMRC:FSU:9682]|uniref:N-alpha-acetyltransferase auxiliary subunit-like n=1 Tax=Lichtheimia corymbifera JMRC:FSU:9682 TaxID=1263082 RepID=A0A068RQE5_9FUNG|nr:n-alpha-acetyltransferase auxiliary subunit-like [Lichtheimia corymbifera JMRC:FSU:9682]